MLFCYRFGKFGFYCENFRDEVFESLIYDAHIFGWTDLLLARTVIHIKTMIIRKLSPSKIIPWILAEFIINTFFVINFLILFF